MKTYYVKTGYEVLRYRKPSVTWRNIVWSPTILPKHSFILWLLFKGRLKIRDFLLRRNMMVSSVCGLCNQPYESIEDLFFMCPVSKNCWERVLLTKQVRKRAGTWFVEMAWIMRRSRGRNWLAKNLQIMLVVSVYTLWGERNRRIFRNTALSQDSLSSMIISNVSLIESLL